MADICGGISIASSVDCIVSASTFVEALNEFQWTSSGGNWITSNDGNKNNFWHVGDFDTHSPTVRPHKTIAVYVAQDVGELLRIPVEMATDEDWDNMLDSEENEAELKILSDILSPHIINGWIEVACCANERNYFVYFESLRIYANGKVECTTIISGAMATPKNNIEVYDPTLITE